MKLTHTTRWATAGAALGLSTAIFAGAAFAATTSPTGGVTGTPSRAEAPAAAQTGVATMTASTTTTAPDVSGPSGATMMSQMLASLSSQSRVAFQALYPQMIKFMDNSSMMGDTGTVGSMMGTSVAGNGPNAATQPSTS